jgi:hypothetical protein
LALVEVADLVGVEGGARAGALSTTSGAVSGVARRLVKLIALLMFSA